VHLDPGDFRQGYEPYLLRPDGTIGVENQNNPRPKLKIIDAHHFAMGFGGNPLKEYTFVGDLDRYLRDLVLAGEYVDATGQHYSFHADGRGFFPKQRFEYRVVADHAFAAFDYYAVRKKADWSDSEFFGFKKVAEELQIFATSGELSDQIADKPMLTLHKRDGNTCCEKR
jgi:hypothetical protein